MRHSVHNAVPQPPSYPHHEQRNFMSSSAPVRRPATKQCEVCHATFTRKTHLNRHMRSHTNDRSHQCKLCSSQFTRSDLLTRHKKICGGFRSRRKSCQACAKAKSRCDLKTPSCSKCQSRGIACEYVTAPAPQKDLDAKADSKPARSLRGSTEFQHSDEADGASQLFCPEMSPVSDSSSLTGTDSCDSSIYTSCSTPAENWPPTSMMPLDFASSVHSSLLNIMDLDINDSPQVFNIPYPDVNLEGGGIDPSRPEDPVDWLNFYNDICQRSRWPSNDLVNVPSEIPHMPHMNYLDSHWLSTENVFPTNLSHSQPSSQHCSPMETSIPQFLPSDSVAKPSDPSTGSVLHSPDITPLEHYKQLFLSEFLNQLPLVHLSTWRVNDKPEVLQRATQLCGALYVKSPESERFIDEVLKGGREEIIMNFVRQTDPMNQCHLILAIVLMQTVGLFHQQAEQRRSSAMYHAMVTTMINRSPVFLDFLQWKPMSDLQKLDSTGLDQAWQDWVQYESAKRVRCLLYMHDCCQSIYFATPATGSLSFNLFLPCENALWNARTSQEWYQLLQQPSRYGSVEERLKGMSLQAAWGSLVEQRPPAATIHCSAFSHFILVHSALAKIYAHMHVLWDNGGASSLEEGASDNTVPRTIYSMQNALHNWLLNWQAEMTHSYGSEAPSTELPFSEDALPFYWLGQISLLMLCEGKGRHGPHTIPDVRFRVVKSWLSRIRECLRTSQTAHAQFTNELMDLRSQYSLVDTATASADHANGLLEFFPVPS